MNRVVLMGTVGFDPVIRHRKATGAFVVFTLATDEHWVDLKGARKQRVDWHKVVIFKPKLAEWCHSHLKKGSKVIVEGKLCNHKQSTKDGQESYASEIIVGSGYGYITCLSPTQERKEEPKHDQVYADIEADEEDEADRIALHHASSQQFSSNPQSYLESK